MRCELSAAQPTGEMTGGGGGGGGFFTKPLQGAAFLKFWNRILNVNEDDLKQQQMLNLADERLSKLSSHHRSVLDSNDKREE